VLSGVMTAMVTHQRVKMVCMERELTEQTIRLRYRLEDMPPSPPPF
jgi:hypothetical protein